MKFELLVWFMLCTLLCVAAASAQDDLLPHETELITAINAERSQYSLPPMQIDPSLQESARRHCTWMVRNYAMQHSGGCAENIAMGYPTVFSAVRGWMNSAGHRANILNRFHVYTGVAGYVAPNGTIYWCQQFASGPLGLRVRTEVTEVQPAQTWQPSHRRHWLRRR